MSTYNDLADAYPALLERVLDHGEHVGGVRDATSVGSEFGASDRPTLELRPFAFRVADPAGCVLSGGSREPSVPYSVAQWLWVMRGSDSLDEIAFYNGRGRVFSDDGQTLNAAMGARVFRPGNQLRAALERLRHDPTSRRAMIVLARPDDVLKTTHDHSCAVSLQLLIRGGRLEAITNMRSQSALMVLPYDASLFMTMHVWAAAALGAPCGVHSWVANSIHVYDDEVERAKSAIQRPSAAVRLPAVQVDETALERLQKHEVTLRTAVTSGDRSGLRRAAIPGEELSGLYRAMALTLSAYAATRMGADTVFRDSVDGLPHDWRDAICDAASEATRS